MRLILSVIFSFFRAEPLSNSELPLRLLPSERLKRAGKAAGAADDDARAAAAGETRFSTAFEASGKSRLKNETTS